CRNAPGKHRGFKFARCPGDGTARGGGFTFAGWAHTNTRRGGPTRGRPLRARNKIPPSSHSARPRAPHLPPAAVSRVGNTTCIGIEREPEYCNIIRQRMAAVQQPPPLAK